MSLFSRETLHPRTWCAPSPDKFVNSSWTVRKTFIKLEGSLKSLKHEYMVIQICLIVLLLQIKWAELTWCSTRFPLDIAATLPDHLVLQALLATKDPAESLDSLVAPVSLEPQVNLEIKEKEVTSFMNILDCHTAEREKWVNFGHGGLDCIDSFVGPPWVELQHKCIAYVVCAWCKSAFQNVITGLHLRLFIFLLISR